MRVLVVGLDGMPPGLLVELAEGGVMVRIAELLRAFPLRPLGASIPEISSVSWTSFMTGTTPGHHGIFGFTDLVPGTRKLRFPRFEDVAVPTLWDRLGQRGLRSVVVNQPATYPARPVPGILVSGFVAPRLERSVFPPRWCSFLRRLGYRVDVDTGQAAANPEGLLADLHATLALRREAVARFWSEEAWTLLEVVVTGTDRLQHFLWPALEEPAHPLHEACRNYYRAVDQAVGEWLDRFLMEEPDGAWFLLSDHGFCRARCEFRLNAWLAQEGYLVKGGEPTPAALGPGTRAFALDPGRIYFTDGEDPDLAAELAARLQAVTYEGRPVVRAVHRRETLYGGPCLERAPHLVVQAEPGFDLKATLKGETPFAPPRLPGMHTPEAFLLTNRPAPAHPAIHEVAGLIEEAVAP